VNGLPCWFLKDSQDFTRKRKEKVFQAKMTERRMSVNEKIFSPRVGIQKIPTLNFTAFLCFAVF
jgi:hypothetical protein